MRFSDDLKERGERYRAGGRPAEEAMVWGAKEASSSPGLKMALMLPGPDNRCDDEHCRSLD